MERSAEPGIPACSRWYGSTEAFVERLHVNGVRSTQHFPHDIPRSGVNCRQPPRHTCKASAVICRPQCGFRHL